MLKALFFIIVFIQQPLEETPVNQTDCLCKEVDGNVVTYIFYNINETGIEDCCQGTIVPNSIGEIQKWTVQTNGVLEFGSSEVISGTSAFERCCPKTIIDCNINENN
jgi:hypothetical protein